MIFFFDRNTGVKIPRALRLLNLPVRVEYHQLHFPKDAPDDVWLPVIGSWGWTVIGQDYKYHLMPNELVAIKQYGMAVFYLWGAEAPRWETVRVFARAYDRIVTAAANVPRPFIYRVSRNGRLTAVPLPP